MEYSRIIAGKKSGNETFVFNGEMTGDRLIDFWQWFASDLLDNTTRGVLAEFIVARSLGLAMSTQVKWDPYDLRLADGTRIEVKSAAYIQSWFQNKPSKIRFNIHKTKAWNAAVGRYSRSSLRQSDIYVFALLAHQDQATIDPLDLNQWQFYVLPTAVLDERLCDTQSVSLSRLLKCDPVKCQYGNIKEAVVELVSGLGD